jgi:hypothetical protein
MVSIRTWSSIGLVGIEKKKKIKVEKGRRKKGGLADQEKTWNPFFSSVFFLSFCFEGRDGFWVVGCGLLVGDGM